MHKTVKYIHLIFYIKMRYNVSWLLYTEHYMHGNYFSGDKGGAHFSD